ncbi:NADH-cytochrome b5 reductase [Phytophthora cinnamomi]|uniref:NADH-cytochrome b5 reductase n=1 Tax=Phytophthora cinnamomi TaxID=4785 RepID=UPI003559F259|nr:NADH-cytochrome b5 reductase [Phytophthora cinnamomi]
MDALLALVDGDFRVLLGVALVAGTTIFLLLSSLKPRDATPVTLQAPATPGDAPPTVRLPLVEKEALSHDTRRFRFALPSPQHVLGLPVGQHISLRYTDESGKLVMRSYTPVSSDDTKGFVDLVVKVYFKNVHPKFPDGGKMSQHLESLAIGDSIEVSGPKGKLSYMGKGEIHIKHRVRDAAPEVRKASKVGMIAGGTGITPMLQVVRRALQDPEDKTEFYLLFANQTEADILCREEIEAMAASHPNVKFWYTVDRAEDGWKYSTGFVSADMIKKHLPAVASDVQIFMCGPPPMLKFAVLPALEELGFTPDQHFSF